MPLNKNITLFIVDDDPLYLRTLELQFRQNATLNVTSFSSGEECLAHLSLKPDVIILDFYMNSINKDAADGLEILKKIRETDPNIHIIMMSALIGAEKAVECIKSSACDLVIKNEETFPKLKAAIKKVLSLYSLEKELMVWDW
jgi:two-component system OmpR family response regulator